MLKDKTRLINELEMLYTLSDEELGKISGGAAKSVIGEVACNIILNTNSSKKDIEIYMLLPKAESDMI